MDHDSEKDACAFDQVERIETAQPSRSDEAAAEYTEREAKNIIRRIDRRLLVTIAFMYCVSLIDRTNVSFAAIAGLAEDLVLTGNRYVRSTLPRLPRALLVKLTLKLSPS